MLLYTAKALSVAIKQLHVLLEREWHLFNANAFVTILRVNFLCYITICSITNFSRNTSREALNSWLATRDRIVAMFTVVQTLILYSGKLSREKTFTNFTVLGPPASFLHIMKEGGKMAMTNEGGGVSSTCTCKKKPGGYLECIFYKKVCITHSPPAPSMSHDWRPLPCLTPGDPLPAELLPIEPFHWGWQWQTHASCWWSACSTQTIGGHSSRHPTGGGLLCIARKKLIP